jgi:hypothetical protein
MAASEIKRTMERAAAALLTEETPAEAAAAAGISPAKLSDWSASSKEFRDILTRRMLETVGHSSARLLGAAGKIVSILLRALEKRTPAPRIRLALALFDRIGTTADRKLLLERYEDLEKLLDLHLKAIAHEPAAAEGRKDGRQHRPQDAASDEPVEVQSDDPVSP